MNAQAAPFVPTWARQHEEQQQHTTFNSNAPAWTPQTSYRGGGGGSQQPPPPPANASQQQPLFYDNGQMIRPHHQPHFFGVAAPLVQVQVGRSGTSNTAPLLPVYDPSAPAAAPAVDSGVPKSTANVIDTTGVAVAAYVPRQTEDLHILNTLSQLTRPVVILVLGGRGSGKTTQSIRIAAKYGFLRLCSGDIVRNGQTPLVVLEDVLKHVAAQLKARPAASPSKNGKAPASPGKAQDDQTSAADKNDGAEDPYPGATRGLVLDRFINNADAEPYFLLELLHKYGLQLDLTINLMMSYEVSMARAEARDEKEAAEGGNAPKPKKDQRRLLEHLTVYNTCLIMRAYGGLECIDVENLTLDQAEYEAQVRVDRTIVGLKNGAAGSRRKKADRPELCHGIQMNVSFTDYMEVRRDVHATLGTPENKYAMAPFSLMTGIVDRVSLLTTMKRFLPDYHVTWKADGDRILIVKHAKFGYIAFTAKFTSFYTIDPKLIPPQWSTIETLTLEGDNLHPQFPPDPAYQAPHGVSYIFDAELVRGHNDKHRIYLFDILYAGPQKIKGATANWLVRYNALRTICAGLSATNAWSFFAVKDFVPCGNIRSLTSVIPPFPTDGIVFQHKGVYQVPLDKRIFKWKPRAQCSVDFRLSGGLEEKEKRRWLFYPLSLRYDKSGADEIAFKNALVVVSDAVVEQHDLADGVVVECIKTDATLDVDGITHELWQFLRPRPDKAFPNNEAIASYIDEMEHMTQDQVVAECEIACGTVPLVPTGAAPPAAPPTAPVAARPLTVPAKQQPVPAATPAVPTPTPAPTVKATLPPASANAWSRGAPRAEPIAVASSQDKKPSEPRPASAASKAVATPAKESDGNRGRGEARPSTKR